MLTWCLDPVCRLLSLIIELVTGNFHTPLPFILLVRAVSRSCMNMIVCFPLLVRRRKEKKRREKTTYHP